MAVAAPAGEGGVEGSAGLITYAIGFVCLGLAVVWNYTAGAGLRSVAHEISLIRLPRLLGHGRVFGLVADAFYAMDNAVHGSLVATANANLHAGRWLFNQAARAFEWLATTIAHLAVASEQALYHFGHVVMPRWTRHALAHSGAFAVWVLHVAERRSHLGLQREHARTTRLTHALDLQTDILGRRVAGEHAHEGFLGHELGSVKARLGKVEKLLGIASVTFLVGTALSRLGLKWLRCGNVGKAGRSICGMNPSLLESLLADALLVGGALSLVELAEHMQGVVGESAGLIQRFWRAG